MPYTIRAQQDGLPVSATRVQAASAVVLGFEWARRGFEAIVIISGDGHSLDLEEAQRERIETLRQGRRLFA